MPDQDEALLRAVDNDMGAGHKKAPNDMHIATTRTGKT